MIRLADHTQIGGVHNVDKKQLNVCPDCWHGPVFSPKAMPGNEVRGAVEYHGRVQTRADNGPPRTLDDAGIDPFTVIYVSTSLRKCVDSIRVIKADLH